MQLVLFVFWQLPGEKPVQPLTFVSSIVTAVHIHAIHVKKIKKVKNNQTSNPRCSNCRRCQSCTQVLQHIPVDAANAAHKYYDNHRPWWQLLVQLTTELRNLNLHLDILLTYSWPQQAPRSSWAESFLVSWSCLVTKTNCRITVIIPIYISL